MLTDARHIRPMLVKLRPEGDYRQLPLDLPLWQILEAVARHERESPTHGTDCICMDQYAREIRKHIYRAVPDSGPMGKHSEEIWQHQFKVRQRIAHVLRMASREL